MKLVAFTQQVTHGKCTAENAPPLGVLDMIGRDRRLAWQNLGDISKDQAMEGFIVLLDKLCPLFRTVVEAQKRDFEEKQRLKREEAKKLEEERKFKGLEEEKKKQEEERLKEEIQRRQIQDALNQQTYYQFKVYAEQQYPGNPEEQGILIRQLQEQHYHQYMQQLRQNQLVIEDQNEKEEEEKEKKIKNVQSENAMCKNDDDDNKDTNENMNDEDSDELEDWPPITPAEMWTRKGVEEFKQIIRRETGDAVIKVGHGETVTVRVPTHEDGTCLFWEFATDGYDIGFGVYFEWSKPETNQVSVYISESEEDEDEEEYEPREDLESGSVNGNVRPERRTTTPPISVIVPVSIRISFVLL